MPFKLSSIIFLSLILSPLFLSGQLSNNPDKIPTSGANLDQYKHIGVASINRENIQTVFRVNLPGYRNGIFTSLHGFVLANDTVGSENVWEGFKLTELELLYNPLGGRKQYETVLKKNVSLPVTSVNLSNDLAYIAIPDSVLIDDFKEKLFDRLPAFDVSTFKSLFEARHNFSLLEQSRFRLIEFGNREHLASSINLTEINTLETFKGMLDPSADSLLDSAGIPMDNAVVFISETETQNGSSGSPIIDIKEGKLIAIHSGYFRRYGKNQHLGLNFIFDTTGMVSFPPQNPQDSLTLLDARQYWAMLNSQFKSLQICDRNKYEWLAPKAINIFSYTGKTPCNNGDPKQKMVFNKVKYRYARSIPAAVDFYVRNKKRSRKVSLEKVLNRRKMAGKKVRQRNAEDGNALKFLIGRFQVRRHNRKYTDSISVKLLKALNAYDIYLDQIAEPSSSPEDLDSLLDYASNLLGEISEKRSRNQYDPSKGMSKKEAKYWKKWNPAYQTYLDGLLAQFAKDIIRNRQNILQWRKLQKLEESDSTHLQSLNAARDLLAKHPENYKAVIEFICKKERQLMDQYHNHIVVGDALAKEDKLPCAKEEYLEAKATVPFLREPELKIKSLKQREKQLLRGEINKRLKWIIAQLEAKYSPFRTPMPYFKPIVCEIDGSGEITFDFKFGMLDPNNPQLKLICQDYPLGKYHHAGINNAANLVIDFLDYIDAAFGNQLQTEETKVSVWGHADGHPYRGKVQYDKNEFPDVNKIMVKYCDGAKYKGFLNLRIGKGFKIGKRFVKEVPLGVLLGKGLFGSSPQKRNRALAYLRARHFFNMFEYHPMISLDRTEICSFIHEEKGGQYRSVEARITIKLETASLKLSDFKEEETDCLPNEKNVPVPPASPSPEMQKN